MKQKYKENKYIKIILILFVINIYFFISLFCGKNTLFNYLKYRKKIVSQRIELNKIIAERDQITKISNLLLQENPDVDILEELLRQSLQATTENEIVILEEEFE